MEPKGIVALQELVAAIVKSVAVSLDGVGLDDIGTHIGTATKAATQWRDAKDEVKDLSLVEGLRLNEFISKEVRVQILGDDEY